MSQGLIQNIKASVSILVMKRFMKTRVKRIVKMQKKGSGLHKLKALYKPIGKPTLLKPN